LKWDPPLTEAILLRRYKRFLADIIVNDKEFTAHVPNTGSMLNCWEPNWRCAVSKSSNPNRKLSYTLEFTHNGVSWIGVNTANANKLVHEWLSSEKLRELKGYSQIESEKKVGPSRIDFFLDGHLHHPSTYVEVKSVTLKLDGVAQFPDAVSLRGQKHLKELIELKHSGHRSVMLFVVQREDVDLMRPCWQIDKNYARLLKEAHEAGVEVLVYQTRMGLDGVEFGRALPFSWE
jgi:sugar fermentation stimulation protein A